MSKAEIFNKMIEEMPFKVSSHHRPYILEAMEIHAQNRADKTLEDVEELIDKLIPKITDKKYQGMTDGFRHYGIDCQLGRKKLLAELKSQKL